MVERAASPSDAGDRRGITWLLRLFATLLALGSIAWAADLYRAVGLALYNEQFLAGMLALALPVVFIGTPAFKGAKKADPRWYDWILAACGFLACAYVVIDYPRLANEIIYRPADALIVGSVLLVLVIEGLRRTVGKILVIVLLVFLAYAMLGHHLPGKLVGRLVDTQDLLIQLALDPQALLGTPLLIATTVVIPFVMFGQLLFNSGGSSFFTEVSVATMGRFRGGAAKISVIASSLFGSISGSAVSNVVSTGVITIPLMRKAGYSGPAAGAIEAVASTGGQLMPPIMGATAFVMAEYLGIPYSEVVLLALIPAILYYVALFILVDLEAARSGIDAITGALPRVVKVLRDGWYFPLPFGVLIYGLFGLHLQPEQAALYGGITIAVCAMVFGYQGKRISIPAVLKSIRETGEVCVEIVLITAAAGLVIGVLNISGLSFGLTSVLVGLGAGNKVLLLLIAATICIILGMGMPTLGVYVLVAALVAPAMVEAGIPLKAAHLFVLYFGMMSMITPPIAIAAFAAASLSRSDPMRTAFEAVRFGWLAYLIPFLFVASPSLLMVGEPVEIIGALITAVFGIYLVSIGIMGYVVRPLGAGVRLLFVAAGIFSIVPADAFKAALITDIAGIVLGALLLGREFRAARRLVSR